MRVETHNKLRDPQIIYASRVVVYDALDNPVSVTVEVENGVIITSHAGDPDFNRILRELGIDKTVIVQEIQQKAVQDIHFAPR